MSKWMDQSTNQSMNKSINQPTEQPKTKNQEPTTKNQQSTGQQPTTQRSIPSKHPTNYQVSNQATHLDISISPHNFWPAIQKKCWDASLEENSNNNNNRARGYTGHCIFDTYTTRDNEVSEKQKSEFAWKICFQNLPNREQKNVVGL